jgi:DNA recombination protein RmuC
MFLPGESFYRAALEQEPGLLELQTRHRVIVAGPTILITLLKTIAVGWREEKVAESARAVSELGRELYERLAVLSEHFVTLGKRLDGAVQAYNQSVGSLERRVLVQARRFTEHGIAVSRELPSPTPIERSAQPPQTAELPSRTEAESAQLSAIDAA